MIMSSYFNPCKMDYSSWLTVAGFSMTLLVLFMNEIFHKLSDKNKEEYIKNYYTILGIVVGTLTIIIIGSILCFIYDREHIGAIQVTIVLFGLAILTILLFIYNLINTQSKRNNSFREKEIDQLVAEYQPDIDLN